MAYFFLDTSPRPGLRPGEWRQINKHAPRHELQIWKIDNDTGLFIEVENPLMRNGWYYEAKDGASIIELIKSELQKVHNTTDILFQQISPDPGHYYGRMARAVYRNGSALDAQYPGKAEVRDIVANSLGQLSVLVRQLAEICHVVHPTPETFHVYGHAIRNLLLLACMEVETHWRGVLVANGLQDRRFSTTDYAKLHDPMRLSEYSVSFPSYPWLEPIFPFRGWDIARATVSLPWYDAYNAVKHNREAEFHRATLGRAFEAVSACAVMMAAQFGFNFEGWESSDCSRHLNFVTAPDWNLPDVYVAPQTEFKDGRQSWNWTRINFPFN